MNNRLPWKRIAGVVLTLGLLTAIVGWRTWDSTPEPPRFLSRSGPASFAEMMAEPPTFIYGSSIHVWVYERDGQTVEVEVTGHADGTTCGHTSGAIFNAMLEKAEDPMDLVVAGASRLVSHEDPKHRDELAQREAVKQFAALRDSASITRLELDYARAEAVESGDDVPAVKQLVTKLSDIDKQLEALKRHPDVVAFRRETASGEALTALVREATRLADTSGLIQVHHLSADLVDKVRARIAKAAATGTPAVVAFDDLLRDANESEAVVLVDELRIGSTQPIELELSTKSLSSEDFKAAVATNRQGVEYAMIGDAEERRRFYKKELGNYDEQAASCRRMPPSGRNEIVELGEECTADGVCFRSPHPTHMSRGEYCDRKIPENIVVVQRWDAEVAEVVKQLQEDKDDTTPEGGRVDRVNHAAVIDSLLRDWTLPVSRGQAVFDGWRADLRRPTWATLRDGLAAQHIAASAVSGEHVVFSVRSRVGSFVIQPVQVVDLARSVIVIDPKIGATRIVDAWELRNLVSAPDEQPAVLSQHAIADSERAIELAEHGDRPAADTALRQAMSLDVTAAIGEIGKRWNTLVRDDHDDAAKLVASTKGFLRTAGLGTALDQLSAEDNSDDPGEFFKRKLAIIAAFPEAPVDLHLAVALSIAELLGGVAEARSGRHDQLPAWDVLEAVTQEGSATRYRATADALEKALGEDPIEFIRATIKLIGDREPEYLAEARRLRGLPKRQSDEAKQAEKKLSNLSLFETEAMSLEKLLRILIQASSAERASDLLTTQGSLDLRQILGDLKAAAASDAAAPLPLITSARDRVEQLIKDAYQPDTLARMEVAGAASRGRDQLVRFAGALVDAEFIWLRGLRDHTLLSARARYEAGDYGKALDTQFPAKVALALAYPALHWERLADDWIGDAERLMVHEDNDTLVVAASRDGTPRNVLRLLGLDRAERQRLAALIRAARWTPQGRGRVSDQVLMLEIPTSSQLASLSDLVRGPSRLAMLRAMVYGCMPPASDLVPPAGRCEPSGKASPNDRLGAARVTAVHIPTLEQVRATANGK